MSGEAQRSKNVLKEVLRRLDERLEQLTVPWAIAGETTAGVIEGTLQDSRRAVVERMGQRGGRLNPFDPERSQGQRPKKRGRYGERKDGRAHVMDVSGQCQLHRLGTAPERRLSLEDENCATLPSQCNGSAQPIRSRPDHDRVIALGHGHLRARTPCSRDGTGKKP
jgi:hypothetical protein